MSFPLSSVVHTGDGHRVVKARRVSRIRSSPDMVSGVNKIKIEYAAIADPNHRDDAPCERCWPTIFRAVSDVRPARSSLSQHDSAIWFWIFHHAGIIPGAAER